tara:strand:+ start:324 stop:827 length:504 start_codon:yes stop_codon:yes gene_type:complete
MIMLKYIKIINNQPINYTIEQLFTDYPDATIYRKTALPNEHLLQNYDVYPLITEASPLELFEDEITEEGIPVFENNEWHQTWRIRKLTQEEINEIVVDREANWDPECVSCDNEEVPSFFVDTEVREARYDICKACTSFTALKTCNECHCIMPLKTKLRDAVCPLGKW